VPLETELALFETMKEELLEHHAGKFVLIHGQEFGGAFDSLENAYAEGIKRYGLEPFLVRPVMEQEEVQFQPRLPMGVRFPRFIRRP
jgi:hypothetical protein